jgi:hypothetical protein
MIQEMRMAGLAPGTHEMYVETVRQFSRHYKNLPPQDASEEQLVEYLSLLQHTAAEGTFKSCRDGLTFLFGNTLRRDWPVLLPQSSTLPGNPASSKPSMSPLRAQMIQDMLLAGLAAGTRARYVEAVLRFSRHYKGLPPQNATEQQLAEYLIHLQQTVAEGTFKVNRYGLTFLFDNTLQRGWPLFQKKSALPGSSVFLKLSNTMSA